MLIAQNKKCRGSPKELEDAYDNNTLNNASVVTYSIIGNNFYSNLTINEQEGSFLVREVLAGLLIAQHKTCRSPP